MYRSSSGVCFGLERLKMRVFTVNMAVLKLTLPVFIILDIFFYYLGFDS